MDFDIFARASRNVFIAGSINRLGLRCRAKWVSVVGWLVGGLFPADSPYNNRSSSAAAAAELRGLVTRLYTSASRSFLNVVCSVMAALPVNQTVYFYRYMSKLSRKHSGHLPAYGEKGVCCYYLCNTVYCSIRRCDNITLNVISNKSISQSLSIFIVA